MHHWWNNNLLKEDEDSRKRPSLYQESDSHLNILYKKLHTKKSRIELKLTSIYLHCLLWRWYENIKTPEPGEYKYTHRSNNVITINALTEEDIWFIAHSLKNDAKVCKVDGFIDFAVHKCETVIPPGGYRQYRITCHLWSTTSEFHIYIHSYTDVHPVADWYMFYQEAAVYLLFQETKIKRIWTPKDFALAWYLDSMK